MTAVDDRPLATVIPLREDLPPAIPSGMFRVVHMRNLRKVAELENNEEITEAEANERMARYVAKGLDPQTRDEEWEKLRDAIRRLSHLDSDMFDPADGDQVTLTLDDDDDAEHALRKLVGAYR